MKFVFFFWTTLMLAGIWFWLVIHGGMDIPSWSKWLLIPLAIFCWWLIG